MGKWRTFEPLYAKAPNGDGRIRLTISKEFLDTHVQVNKLTPIFQISAHLFGRLPEINLIGRVVGANPTTELTTLDSAYACFRGIKRPLGDEDDGESILVYVLRPAVSIEFHESMSCIARPVVPPANSVLTALVRIENHLQDADGAIDGSVTRLEWVFADGGDPALPNHSETRYNERCW